MTKLPKPAWGWIDRLPSGRIRLRGPIEGERTTVGTFDTVEEALGAALEMARTLAGAPRGLTIGGWLERWLERRELAGKHRSIDDMRGLVTRYVDDTALAARLVRDTKPKHVAQWLDSLSGRQLARSTLRNALGVLSVSLRDAVMAGHLHANPCAGVVLPRAEARTEDEWTFLSTAEITALLTHAELDATARRVFTIAIYTGLRQGELLGLRWEDVDLDAALAVVRYGNSKGGPTKSGKPRTIPLFAPARAALLELRELGGVRRVAGHVFTWTPRGEPPRPYAAGYDAAWAGTWDSRHGKRRFRKGWRERCGVRASVRFHDLRHTFASHLVMGTWGRTWRLEEVQVVLGHTAIATTQRYAHLAPEGMARVQAEAERMWSEPSSDSVTASVTPIGGRRKNE